MKGFFNIVDTEEIRQTKRKKVTKVFDCSTCGLDKKCNSPRMKPSGKGRLKILVMAEAPGEEEDKRNTQLVGTAGRFFRQVLSDQGLDLDLDFWKTNAICCRPPSNRTPTDFEVECCKKNWKDSIEKYQPNFIWLMGDVALDAFFSDRISRDDISISSWRRWCIPDRATGAWIIPMYHPSYIRRMQDKKDEIAETVFRKDIKWAIAQLSREAPKFRKYEKRMRVLKTAGEVIQELQKFNECTATFDYETSGTKPYLEGHAIRTIGLKRRDFNYSVAFPFQWPGYWNSKDQLIVESYWKKFLRDPSVFKIAHNMKFEHVWSTVVLKTEPMNWHFDTMHSAHMLDVRQRLSGLDIQLFLRFGIEPYDQYIKTFFKQDSKGFNTLHLADLDKVLDYQNKDAFYEDLLYTRLFPQVENEERTQRLYHLYHEGVLTFADCEMHGFNVKEGYYDWAWNKIEKRVIKLKEELETSAEAKKFKKLTGQTLSLRSTKQLGTLFYQVLKEKVTRRTGKTQVPSLDEKALTEFESTFAKKLLRMRRYRNKWLNTYIRAYRTDVQNGKIHPFHNLHVVRTGRPSSDKPNLYNIPKRETEAMKLIRGGLIPSEGHELVSVDYKMIEVSVQACNSKDPVLIKYCEDVRSDMHRDEAMSLFMLKADEVTKELRQECKNAAVFPELYGDWYASIAKELWKRLRGHDVMAHLRRKGISEYEEFERHVKIWERKFWGKLRATAGWRDRMVEEYKRKLYVESLSGWRRNGLIFRNELCNTPVQNAAFTCLLWSLIEINKLRKKEKWRTGIIGQIYDQIIFDMHPEEKKRVCKKVEEIMCEKIKEQYPWIIVPLRVEFESSGINNSWAVREEED